MGKIPNKIRELILPLAIIGCVLVIIVPLSPAIIDLLLAANITLAVIVLLATIQAKSPLELSVFPSLLLAATLGRLVLNVATTRLILSNGADGEMAAAGGVIQSFGQFVAGEQIVVGLIIFAIIVVIQFVVITKGATRISEVAARFSLDGMPGKQMAIDADLNAGLIDQRQAQKRRQNVERQADFYGAMDGASKFVRGDAIAGIMITLINIVGGLAIGLSQGMSIGEATSIFTMLTIGDGLASQIPAFLIAVAAAMLITRSTERTNLPIEFLTQIFARPQVLFVAAGFLAVLTLTQLPTIPLLTIGGCCVGIAFVLTTGQKKHVPVPETSTDDRKSESEKIIEDCLTLDPIEFELGVDLIQLADPNRNGKLLDMVTDLRRSFAAELGIILPKVRVRDNLELDRNQFRIKIQQLPVRIGQVHADRLFAIRTADQQELPPGIVAEDPASGEEGVWIHDAQIETAVQEGLAIFSATELLIAELKEAAGGSASQLLTREATAHLVQQLRSTQPSVVDELIPDLLTIGQVQQVLQSLLRENVSIRQFQLILETLADHARSGANTGELTEAVRKRLAAYICQRISRGETLRIVRFDSHSRELLKSHLQLGNDAAAKQSDWSEAETEQIQTGILDSIRSSYGHALVVEPAMRPRIRRLIGKKMPSLPVLSETEVSQSTDAIEVGQVVLDFEP